MNHHNQNTVGLSTNTHPLPRPSNITASQTTTGPNRAEEFLANFYKDPSLVPSHLKQLLQQQQFIDQFAKLPPTQLSATPSSASPSHKSSTQPSTKRPLEANSPHKKGTTQPKQHNQQQPYSQLPAFNTNPYPPQPSLNHKEGDFKHFFLYAYNLPNRKKFGVRNGYSKM